MIDILNQIKTIGYCHLPEVYTPQQIKKTLSLVKKWYQKTEYTSAKDVQGLARDDIIVWNLQNKDYYFLELLLNNSQLQDILMHFLNDQWYQQIPSDQPNYILRSFLARTSKYQLPLHIDCFIPYLSEHIFAMQICIPLQDQTIDNGCTYLVPGSHLSNKYAPQNAFEQAIPIKSKAGDMIVWDSRTWHAAGNNQTKQTRWALIVTFTRWWLKQMFNITASLPKDIHQKLNNSQKAVLGFYSTPWDDETQGINMKQGYAAI